MSLLRSLLGIGADELTSGQMALRAVLTFIVSVAIVRFGHKRLFGKSTAFDLVVAVMFGSIMSRAITNSLDLVGVWLAGLVLVLMHRLIATISYHVKSFGPLVKGNPVLLVEDGQVRSAGMRKSHVSLADLDEALRGSGSEPDLSRVRLAYLERDGSISVIPRPGEERVVDVTVADNVQVVRIAMR
ncbi:DUF421 domain-containing protein [Micromonospora lutea]|uniref:YetF C-terminal domain-containing protein n=1 Tax=Micromonospora lutea TaxID=419825 RepID=A0ABQ4IVM9_9ACTN|nr:YetF domain-containing protein [Micromonospora lutea]GIJ21967.1 hypothetical protein Vlu01_25910 [Micromonospora lutea]